MLGSKASAATRSQVLDETLRQTDVRCNLAVMVFIWSTCSINFYTIMYLVNTFENVYASAISISVADVTAYAASGFLVEKLNVKKSLFCSLLLSALGGFIILVYGLDHQESTMFPILFFVTKLGISSAFGILYVGNAKIFPEEIVASAMGRCQVLARIFGAIQFFLS